MQAVINMFLAVFFIAAIISVPLIIVLLSRKIAEWIVSGFILLIFLFYYSNKLISFFVDHYIDNPLVYHIIDFLYSCHIWVLDHWPRFNGITLFGVSFLGIKADYQFTSTIVPLITFLLGGLIRFIVVKYVPHDKLREKTREYWLYITFTLIFLFVISNVSSWNILTTLVIFLLALIIVATGLPRIIIDLFIAIYAIIQIVFNQILLGIEWLCVNLRYVALAAVKVTKFLNNFFRRIKELYEEHIQKPFKKLHRRIINSQNAQRKKIDEIAMQLDERLKKEKLDERRSKSR